MEKLTANYGTIVQDLYNEWDKIKTQEQYNAFSDKIKALRFGIYGTITLKEVIEKHGVKGWLKAEFIKEVLFIRSVGGVL